MAPWPEQGNEPKAPDKSCNKSVENSSFEASKVSAGNPENLDVNAASSKLDDKQADERNAHVSNLDDGQLRALLDEAIAYKCPKDREGKSNLFRELLQEAEANEDGDSRRGLAGVGGSRYYNNSNRRRGRRDAQVSERQTRGGSLQNLVHASNSEFDPAAGYGGFHSGGSRTARKSKRSSTGSSYGGSSVGGGSGGRDCGGVSVSARQREGGSLPSNVNVGGMLTLSGLDYHATPSLPFDDLKSCKQASSRRREFIHSSSSNEFTSMPVQASTINSSGSGSGAVESDSATVPSNSNCVVPKSEFMVLNLGDYVGENKGENKGGSNSGISLSNVTSTNSANSENGLSCVSQNDTNKVMGDRNGTEEEGLELEVLKRAEMTTRVPNYTSRATLEVGQSENKKVSSAESAIASATMEEVDTTVTLPLEIIQCSMKSSSTATSVNGVEQTSLQLRDSYTSVKSIISSTSSSTVPRDDKSIITKGSDIAKHSSGSETVGKSSAAATAATVSAANAAASAMPVLPVQHHLSVLSLPPSSWINAPLVPVTSEKHESSYSGLTTWYHAVTVKQPTREDVNRLSFTHGSVKDCSGESKSKSLDENGNAVNRFESSNSNNPERKGKQRKTKTNNDRNVIMSQNIEGYRGDKDLDTVLKFIESNSDGKGSNKTKNATSHSNGPMNFNSKQQRNCTKLVGCGTKARKERGAEDPSAEEERVSKTRTASGKQGTKDHRGKSSKLKKSNSLEEISKTKLEDLTSNSKDRKENGTAGDAEVNDGSSSVLVRRPKKQTLDNGDFYGGKARVGDRRSWGTEEGQQYYCNDGVTVSADEGSSGSGQTSRKRRGNASITSTVSSDEKKRNDREETVNIAISGGVSGASEETDFLVVTKKHRKKRRSSSGGRGTSASTGGSIFGEDGWRSDHHNYGSSYYQNRDGGGGPYCQRKSFTAATSGFPPHDRTVERDSGGVMLYTQYRHHRPRSPDHLRRKSTSSMPPSDKSDSSDLDSVHSLPVSSTTPKLTLDQTSTSSGSTPQASYADIARMASSNVPSTPTQSHNYVNINLNASRWPVMGGSKNMAISNSVSCTATTSPSISTPTSSNSIVTVPVASSNPQFITGHKLNIGAPPVSGSKAAVSSGNNYSGPGLVVNPSTVGAGSGSVADDMSQFPLRKESEIGHSSFAEQTTACKTRSTHSHSTDTRTKKDAMTNTSLDYNISPSCFDDKELGLKKNNTKPIEKVNFLRDGDYPSLEESLCPDKLKNMKAPSPALNPIVLVHGENSTVVSTVDTPDNNVIVSVSKAQSESEEVSVLGDSILPIVSTQSSFGASAVTTSNTPATVSTIPTSLQSCVPDSASAEGVCEVPSDVTDISKIKDANLGKNKNCNKKTNNSGNRPPVIILDENDQSLLHSEGLTTISEYTFGFEVNELLLMTDDDDGEDEVLDNNGGVSECSPNNPSPTTVEDEANPTVPTSTTPVSAICSPGEDFSARYREPLIQPDNHDKIVTFVGLAWDDILKEMNCAAIHSGGKVQYYSGQ